MLRPRALFIALLGLAACGSPKEPQLSDVRIGHCTYTGPQSRVPECKDYLGAWKVEAAEKDCKDLQGTFEGGSICAPPPGTFLGACLFGNKPEQNRTYIVTTDTGRCGGARTGCEFFGGGYWAPSSLCGNVPDEVAVYENAWVQPKQKCFTPGPGEGPGSSDGGMVCVWESIHGATEEGRSFRDDANCDNSRSGRPYYPKNPDPRFRQADPRRSDPAYLAEEAWVRSQINSTSCVCCHSNAAPNAAASIFNIDLEGSLANQLTDRGIAHGSGTVPSIPLGAFPASMNNGFAKSDWEHPDFSIFLSTDPARMKRFWQAEEAYRGLTAANFVGVPDGFGPLSEQLFFQPQACADGEGIAADGTITWGKGRARYVYVLEASAKSPTVWPNLDLPEGTLWRLDVPPTSPPLENRTVKYGVVPPAHEQRFPVAGAPAALTSGRQYYLYVTADVMLPFTRCLFTAP
jgi:hypothetical protein